MKLSSDFTTLEQSKQLLELGVPKNSANLYYNKFGALEAIPEYRNFNEFCDSTDTPCWSVGRLIEILTICYTKLPFETEISNEYGGVDSLVVAYNNLISDLDFLELEE